MNAAKGITNWILICSVGWLCLLLPAGCTTLQPQVIEYCSTYYLYVDGANMGKAYKDAGGELHRFNAFYRRSDNSIHAMKWDFESLGHEVYHGLETKGLIVEEGIGKEHFRRK